MTSTSRRRKVAGRGATHSRSASIVALLPASSGEKVPKADEGLATYDRTIVSSRRGPVEMIDAFAPVSSSMNRT